MTPRISKLMLTAHITFSVGWLGAVAAFLALAFAGLTSQDAQMVRSSYLPMEPTTRFVIIPLAFASLATGLVVSLGTKWCLFRNYWVATKLLINIAAIIILLMHMRLISYVASAAATTALSNADLHWPRIQLIVKAGAALLALLTATTLGVYKPWGLTRYGHNKLDKSSANLSEIDPSFHTPNSPSCPGGKKIADGFPVGFKVFLGGITLLALVFVGLHLTGHGMHHGH